MWQRGKRKNIWNSCDTVIEDMEGRHVFHMEIVVIMYQGT